MAGGNKRKTTVRTLTKATLKEENGIIEVELSGDGFLYNMVRIIAGTLMEVGQGKRTPESMKEVLAALDRSAAGPTAPAHGLMLMKYDYI